MWGKNRFWGKSWEMCGKKFLIERIVLFWYCNLGKSTEKFLIKKNMGKMSGKTSEKNPC